jgi:hypothetical protein
MRGTLRVPIARDLGRSEPEKRCAADRITACPNASVVLRLAEGGLVCKQELEHFPEKWAP